MAVSQSRSGGPKTLTYDPLIGSYCETFDNTDPDFACLAANEEIEVCIGVTDFEPATYSITYLVGGVGIDNVSGNIIEAVIEDCDAQAADSAQDYETDISFTFNACTATKLTLSGDLSPGGVLYDNYPNTGLGDFDTIAYNCDPFQITGETVSSVQGFDVDILEGDQIGACNDNVLLDSSGLESRVNLFVGPEFTLTSGGS